MNYSCTHNICAQLNTNGRQCDVQRLSIVLQHSIVKLTHVSCTANTCVMHCNVLSSVATLDGRNAPVT
eukprot:13529-Heterococcus_DN1.PRE.5